MIDYKDPIPPILNLLNPAFEDRVSIYGNTFPISSQVQLPAVLVRQAGGSGYFRIQLLVRARVDYEAMGILIEVMNYLERNAQFIMNLDVLWCERESNPIPATDEDTNLPEAWCYMRLESAEANSMG